jgi:hypothetical protein
LLAPIAIDASRQTIRIAIAIDQVRGIGRS